MKSSNDVLVGVKVCKRRLRSFWSGLQWQRLRRFTRFFAPVTQPQLRPCCLI